MTRDSLVAETLRGGLKQKAVRLQYPVFTVCANISICIGIRLIVFYVIPNLSDMSFGSSLIVSPLWEVGRGPTTCLSTMSMRLGCTRCSKNFGVVLAVRCEMCHHWTQERDSQKVFCRKGHRRRIDR